MFPRIPVLGLPTNGVLVAAGFLLALALVRRTSRRAGFGGHVVEDTVI